MKESTRKLKQGQSRFWAQYFVFPVHPRGTLRYNHRHSYSHLHNLVLLLQHPIGQLDYGRKLGDNPHTGKSCKVYTKRYFKKNHLSLNTMFFLIYFALLKKKKKKRSQWIVKIPNLLITSSSLFWNPALA